MSRLVVALVLWIACASVHAAVEPYFAPAVPSGSLTVTLHATENVLADTPTLVTFGVPFPRGSITTAQLGTLRVLRGGVEIPAHVEELTPWRHRSNPAIDGQSVRVALVQVTVGLPAFPATDTIVVQWGGAARTLDVPVRVDPRSAWHTAASGTYVASDNVAEPDVYAVLPRDWLARGLLRPRGTPSSDPAPDVRDDPSVNAGIATWPGFQESERAHKNNFFTVINRDDPSVTNTANLFAYKTSRVPWLYDRAATMYALYLRSGSFVALREAVRATDFYVDRQDAGGFFTLDGAGGDVKYAYNESLAYTYWLVGDVSMLTPITRTATAADAFPHAWTEARGFWTERHAAFKLLAKVVAYEVTGSVATRSAVEQILTDLRAHQDGLVAGIPAVRVDGALYHLGRQHDSEFTVTRYGASSWMTALLVDAVVRAYGTGEDAATAQFVVRMAQFLRSTIVTRQSDYGVVPMPRYLVLEDGTDGFTDGSDSEHSLDVGSQIAWGHWFSEATGTPDTELEQAARSLYGTYDASVNFWIRPGAPPVNTQYRVATRQKWGWEHRVSTSFQFALTAAPAEPPLFADGFEP